MAKEIAIVQVCFNLLDPFQQQLYERVVSYPNRSGYVKRLIQREVDRERPPVISRVKTKSEDFDVEMFI